MLTLNVTDQFGITIPQVSVLTSVVLQVDRHNNLLVATAGFSHFENAAAYAAGVSSGSDQYDIFALVAEMKQGQVQPSYVSIETYLMQQGQPFAGAQQTPTSPK